MRAANFNSEEWPGVTLPHLPFSAAGFVLLVAVVQLIAGVVVHCMWLLTRSDVWLRGFFGYLSPVFFVLVGLTEIYFSVAVARASPGLLGRSGWAMIAAAAVTRLIRLSAIQVVTVGFRITPDFVLYRTWFSPAVGARTRLSVLSGPVPLALLVAGFLLLIAERWKSGSWRWPKLIDVLAVVALLMYIAASHRDVTMWLHARSARPVPFGAGWLSLPLRALALALALLLYRQSAGARATSETKCWTAFGAALITAVLINVCLWLNWRGYLPWPQSSFVWYLQFPAAAALALAPVYALDAVRKMSRVQQPAA